MLNRCMVFVYFFVCLEAIIIELNATTTTTTAPRYDIPQAELVQLDNLSSSLSDPLMRFTQIKGIQLEGKSERVKSVLKETIQSEVKQIIKELGYDNYIQSKQSVDSSCGKETLLLLLDNLAREVTQLRSTVKSLDSDIELWKTDNNRSEIAFRGNINECATKPSSKKSSIGVNYNPKTKVDDGFTYKGIVPKDCDEVKEQGNNKTGVYKIQPRASKKPFMVLCDMETKGGGWAHIQKRFDGSQDFYLDWRDYKFGFGDLDGEFWLGLENIYALIGFEVNELLVEVVDRDNVTAYAHYKAFGIGPEADGYPLNVLRGFSGDAGDSLVQHFGSKFSTKDFDRDENEGHCAQMYLGGWWYKSCHVSNLNGKFINAELPKQYKFQGMHWLGFRGHEYCHARARMMVRPARPT